MDPTRHEPVAIIGSSCRFPGSSSSPDRLWELLKTPKDLLKDIPLSRFNAQAFYHSNGDYHGATNVSKSYFLDEEHRAFDASFFNISPREAEAMDPQQRFLLEVVYEAVESAGYPIDKLKGSETSVSVGVMTGDYHDLQLRDLSSIPQHLATGTSRSILSNRISYFFDWKGPSLTIDTACSSSLVAVHQAICSLRNGSPIAIAAGANAILGPEPYVFESKLHMLSPTGRSRMWDADADGYARGEGYAAVVLKLLSKAIEDGDHIESIIRGSAVGQDGYGPQGLTMPIAASQIALIQRTYKDAGLDPKEPSNRCQYFEAHGTGTLAGDPVEAEAVSKAFFPAHAKLPSDQVLHVGSIKTVIGHLEGTAGIAGLIKGSLVVQKGIIPPNLLFKNLNPTIEPFYTNLKVPTVATPWPQLPNGVPRRVSVNSFGFGGTNAHVIIESYAPSFMSTDNVQQQNNAPVLPLILSTKSEYSMVEMLKSVRQYLSKYPDLNLSHLNYTSIFHRTMFPYRISFPASDSSTLQSDITGKISELETSTKGLTRRNPNTNTPKPIIFGVFTGQGAQWPGMGSSLVRSCHVFTECIQKLDKALEELPDGPSWTLMEVLQAPIDKTRIHEAAISQPACTALQIALVDLLDHIGISFTVVVGHSSGEIAAAYAAGCISAKDAIRIAYYRGMHTKLAAGPYGEVGGMIATGYSFSQATVFCEQDQWEGRLVVAASNGPKSTTLSGDYDAIIEAKETLDGEGTFARILKVDKAYHSHHMDPCAEPYIKSMEACGIAPQLPSCVWVSSVQTFSDWNDDTISSLKGPYWRDNMANPVLFSQAVTQIVQEQGSFDVALEIGPHSALAGPSTQTVKEISGVTIPYYGALQRNRDDIETFSATIGFLLTHLDVPKIDVKRYIEQFSDDLTSPSTFLKGFPSYPWHHDTLYWKESRISNRFRLRHEPIHELLGTRSSDDTDEELRWRNVLRLQELPWAPGHHFQQQALFPAAGYMSMALEASQFLAKGKPIQSVMLSDIQILRAITLQETSAGVETLFTLNREEFGFDGRILKAHFTLYACTQDDSNEMVKHCSGNVTLTVGDPSIHALPGRSGSRTQMSRVDVDRFYESLSGIGLDYSGAFRGIVAIDRRMDVARTEVTNLYPMLHGTELLVHPAFLDSCLQGLFAAFAAPGDGSLWTTYLPTSLQKAVFNFTALQGDQSETAQVDAYVTKASSLSILGDVEIFDSRDNMQIQLEGLKCDAIAKASPVNDRNLFAKTIWEPDMFGVFDDEVRLHEARPREQQLTELCERLSYFYLRNLRMRVAPQEEPTLKWNFQRLLDFTDHVLPLLERGSYQTVDPNWIEDPEQVLDSLSREFHDQVDVQIIRAVGSNLVDIVRGRKETLEVMRENNMLDRLYTEGMGTVECNEQISMLAHRITHRHPHMRILEIGAGTGGTTRSLVKGIGKNFSAYYYTDISAGFFERAREILDGGKVSFMTLDIEKDPIQQGFEAYSFDMIVASNVLHATKFLKTTMKNVRKLLKPGGYLLLLETTGRWLRSQFVMCGLPGWWLGRDDGRPYTPTITEAQWDALLESTGFSGIDIVKRDSGSSLPHSISVMLSQAVDERVEALRQPLAFPDMVPTANRFIILGGKSLRSCIIIRDIQKILRPWRTDIEVLESPEAIVKSGDSRGLAILSLIDFDEPYFRDMTAIKFNALQNMFRAAKQVLWAGENGRAAKPHVNMMVGLARTLQHEVPELSLQLLDFEDVDKEMTVAQTAHYLATSILRLILSGSAKWMENILWSNELEILIKNWKLWIPRVKTDPRPNDRLNSSRRKIISTADLELLQVEICQKEDTREWSISCNDRISKLPVPEDYVKVRVKFSLIHPIRLMAGSFFFLCLGDEIPTGRQVIAVSRSNASVIVVPVAWTTLCRFKDRGEEAQKYLWVFACGLIGRNIIEASPISNTALVHEPDEYLRTILTYQANQIGMAIRFTRLHSSAETEDSSIVVHPFASSRHTRGVLPQNVESVFDMSNSAETIASMARCAPHLFWHPTSWTFGPRPILSGDSSSTNSIRDILSGISCLLDQRTAMTEANISPNALGLKVSKHLPLWNELESLHFPNDRLVRAADFAMNDAPRITPFTIISWEQTTTIPICINPVDASKMFSHEKSYLLVGLTGELGQSLARWMVLNGARYIVLTSRNPQVHSQWLEEIRSSGVVIEITPLDVSDLLGLRKVVENIRATMPPIGGVANAAMVLSDQSFMEMSIDQFDRVIRPKVTGSQNLDDLFPSDKSLDFFILFSSLAAVVGNRGQANYNAANMYLTSLARQRRRRGVVASVMNIGMIIGLGYLSRFGTTYEEKFRKMNFMPISEHELHTMFAEAIIAGKSESEDDTDMIIGLQEATGTEDVANLPAWFKDPRFSHMVQSPSAITETPTSKKSIFSVAEQLSQAASYSEVCSKLQDALVNHLGRMLQMPTEKINANTPLTSLGIDSLIAVDLRTWLLAQLKVDVPIFKILGGPSIVQMCAEIVPKLAKELLPAIDREDALEQKSVKGLETSNAELQHAPKQEVYQEQTESPIRNQPTSPSQDSSDRSTSTGAWNIITEAESSVPSEVFVSSTISPETDSMTQNIKFIKEGKASIGQSSLLFLRNYLKDGSTSNIGIQFTLRGPLKQNRFADAINAVISKHEILRTAFHRDVGLKTQVQAVLERSSFQLQYKTMGTDAEMQREYDRLMSTEFDLNRGHTMEAILIRRSANIYNAMFCYHHVIMDGVSWRLFVNELHQAYKSHSMAPLDHHQIEFAQKEEDMLNRGELASELVHWKNEFAQLPETLPLLPISKVPCRRALTVYDTSTVSLNLDLTIGARIRQASKALAITPFQFYLSTLQVLLFLHTGTPDQCIGMVDANRSDQDFANTIGYFINTLALRFNVDGSLRFEELAVQTRKKVYLAMANSRLPFNVLLDELKIPRSTTHSPLFQVLMNYRLGALEQNKLGDCDLTDMKGTVPKTPYDMTLLVVETSKGDCLLQFDVQKYLYSDDDTCQLLKSYMHLLDILSQNPSSKINECNVFSSAMIQESLEHARGNIPLEIDPNATLLDHIDSHFRRSNANIAIKDSYNQVWQYGDLEKKVHALCSKLHATGIQRSGSIALLCEPSADAVCAMLAIWRHGATCIPLDLSNPVARLDAIINECQPAAILFHHQSQHVLSRLNTQGAPGIEISDEIQTADVHQSRVESFAKPDSHALLLYTSGTTGKPKGIALTHINLLNCILGIQKSLNLGQETVLQQSSLGFDLSIAQILISLSGGGRLIIPKREQRGDAIELSKLMLLEKVTFTFCVPSEYSILLRFGHADLKKCSEWRVAMSAGERLTSRIKEEFRGLGSSVKLFNAYGPAETTIISHLTEVSYHFDDYADGGEEFESVGRPLPNFSTYIVDEARNPVPVGFPGEVCIGGPSVSPGYSHNDVLNEQKFFPNQFSTQHEKEFKWDRLYRSGDRGRLLSDGSLLPLGRIDGDHQIKLRGMRVELGSIESSILTTARGIIRDAIVIERGQPSFLVGFVTFVEDNRPRDPENFLRTLIGELPEPEYMRPMVIVPLESIPRGANGKTDRNALRKVAIQRNPETQPTDNEPLTATESKLSELWRGLLFEDGATPLDIHKDTDFFAVGGTSLLLVELQHLIHEEFQVSIPLRDFFQASSLRRMAERTIPGVTQTELPRQINWAEETAISHDLLDIKKLPVTESSGRQLRVVLTGAFGFLGKAILQCLVDNSSVSEIHCIAIRQKNGSPGRKSPIKSDKISVYPGDLSLPLLGLSESEFDHLSHNIDVIIHNGAEVSFLKSYQALRAPNVSSTKELVKLSLPRSTPIHFISTGGVAQLVTSDVPLDESVPASALSEPGEDTDGYVATKYASERYLENAAGQLGLSVFVHRPTYIVGSGASATDVVGSLLEFSGRARKVPILRGWEGEFDLVGLKQVAGDVVGQCLESVGEGVDRVGMQIRHQCGEKKFRADKLGEYVRLDGVKRSGGASIGEVLEVEWEEWLHVAEEAGLSKAMGRYLGMLAGRRVKLPQIIKGRRA